MKISSRFKLDKSQYELDFVDIDTNRDKSLFIDPSVLATRVDEWSREAVLTLQCFFGHLMRLLRANKVAEAEALFAHLGEPNETRLGLSRGAPRGRGVGPEDTKKIFQSLVNSKAIKTGLIEDIEDCTIFVEDFGPDKLSDMTTNIIRGHLISYTKTQCELHRIPMQANVASGPLWDRKNLRWYSEHTEMLVVSGKVILLVPKGIVSLAKLYTPEKYHQHDVLNFLKQHHLSIGSVLVRYRSSKNKKNPNAPYVTKKSIVENDNAELSKEFLTDFTLKHPEVFKDFKVRARNKVTSLRNEDISPQESLRSVCIHLLDVLKNTIPGNDHATQFHNVVTGVLELCFYPMLSNPKKENEINEGRKRIDIVFQNSAKEGFFAGLQQIHDIPCHMVPVECKNYSREIENPEVDQLAGRLSNARGKVGILVCRSVKDRDRLLKRCGDFWKDQNSLLLPLDDDSLVRVLTELRDHGRNIVEDLLAEIKGEVISRS